MDSSVRTDQEQESGTQQEPKRFLVLLVSIIKRMARLIHLTEEERDAAGIFIDRLGDQ